MGAPVAGTGSPDRLDAAVVPGQLHGLFKLLRGISGGWCVGADGFNDSDCWMT